MVYRSIPCPTVTDVACSIAGVIPLGSHSVAYITCEATSTPTIPVAMLIGAQPPWSAVMMTPATRQMAKVTSPRTCELHRGWLTSAMTLGSSEPRRIPQ